MEYPIKKWPKEDRPRERLLANGEHTLSDCELLAILLSSGVKDMTAVDLARQIMDEFKSFRNMAHTSPTVWKRFKGIGDAKLARIKAAIEIGRRLADERPARRQQIKGPRDVYSILSLRMRDLKEEAFKCVFLNTKNYVLDIKEYAFGSVAAARPNIRQIISDAIALFASGIIFVHNHPSGDPEPSVEDISFTKRCKDIAAALEILLLDHIVIGDGVYVSLSERDLI